MVSRALLIAAVLAVFGGCAQERSIYTHWPRCHSDRECDSDQVCADGVCADGDRREAPDDVGAEDAPDGSGES